MRITMVRHAQPDWGPDGYLEVDPALTPLGHRQAESCATRLLAEPPPDVVLVSPALRAVETAAPILDALDTTPVVLDWLHEVHILPEHQGRPFDAYIEEIAPPSERPFEDWENGARGTAEPFESFMDRVTGGLDVLLAGHGVRRAGDPRRMHWEVPADAPHVMMVVHGGTISAVVTTLLGLPTTPWEWERLRCPHAGVSVMEARRVARGHLWSLTLFADDHHLAPDERSY